MSQGFGLRHNRPSARTFSPLRLWILGLGLLGVILAGFAVPAWLGSDSHRDRAASSANRRPAVATRRLDFEDAPRSYSELGGVEPVNVFREPEVAKTEVAPKVIVREVVREVPVNRPPSKAELMAEAAWTAPVTFSSLEGRSADGSVTMLGPRTLPSGHRIRARLDGAINSETPGFVAATVVEDPRGLAPAGAKLVGQYDGTAIRFTGSRLPVTFSELQAGGRAIAIQAQAADEGGRAGLEGDVDRHLGALMGLSALNVVSGAAIGSTARRGDDFEAALAGESIREGARLTRDIGRQVLEVAPTIEIPAGTPFWIVLLEPLRL